MVLYYGSRTDIGRGRSSNQDAVSCDPQTGLFVVADGMGGHSGGETASRVAIETIQGAVSQAKPNYQERMFALVAGIREANHKIHILGSNDAEKRGMGTTVTALLVDQGRYFITHVGDSRAYIIRNGKLIQITRDHSFVQHLVDSGIINSEQARVHERRNEITRAVGIAEDVKIDTFEGEIKENEAILLCSDGLWGELSEEEILEAISRSNTPQEACDRLIDWANDKGGHDNISVIIVQLSPSIGKFYPLERKFKRRFSPSLIKRTVGGAAGLLLLLLLALILGRKSGFFTTDNKVLWIGLQINPETLNVAMKKAGIDTLIENNDSLCVGLGETLRFYRKGYYDSIVGVVARDTRYRIVLRPILVPVNLLDLPPETDIEIYDTNDFLIKRLSTGDELFLPFGMYKILIKHPDYKVLEREFLIADTEAINLPITLEFLPASTHRVILPKVRDYWITITAFAGDILDPQIASSEVYLDGSFTGQRVPTVKKDLIRLKVSPGKHTITLVKGGKTVTQKEVTLTEKNSIINLGPNEFKR